MASPRRWDIFCTVVDNYGDAGVCWRLARQLAAEHGLEVCLWLDDPAVLARLWPGLSAQAPLQRSAGVTLRHWRQPLSPAEPADVVIEAFGCRLPAAYLEAMARRTPPPLWLNLEYLSAEPWVAGCHALPSPQPGYPLAKFFFFPGFGQGTGGLLRERDLLARRRRFDAAAQRAFLAGLGIDAVASRRLSLFAYENASVASLLGALAAQSEPWLVLVPEGRVLGDVARWLGAETLPAGARQRRGALEIAVLPLLSQADYDLLLWSCELNAVRGEDSFVRAQWAGVPLLWQIYPQRDGAHWDKLDAFLTLYAGAAAGSGATPPAAAAALAEANRCWNRGGDMAPAWAALRRHSGALQAHARRWAETLATQPDLASQLVRFAEAEGGRL